MACFDWNLTSVSMTYDFTLMSKFTSNRSIYNINDIAEIVESGVKHHKPARLGINLKY
jgi:hypothetical protein